MKIRTQLTLAIVIFGIALLLIAGSVIATNQQVDRLNNQQALAKNIEIEANELGYLSSDYILYRESQQAERWESKYSALASDIRSLSVDAPGQQVLVNNLMENRDRMKNVFDDIKSGIGSTPQGDPASDLAVIQVSWSRLAVQTQGVVFDAGRLSELLHDEAEQVMRLGNILIFLLMGTFSLFILISYFIVYRRTLSSIAELQDGTKVIGSGNLDHTIPERGNDEISDLSRAFNRMTAELKGVTASKTDLEREVAERRRAEEEVGERNEELEAMNEELTAAQEELQTANTDLAAHEQNLIRKNIDLNALNEELISTQDELHRNISELTRARDEVRNISEQLQVALDAAKLGSWHYDPVTRKSRFDQRYREIFSVGGEEMPNDEILSTRIYPDDLLGLWSKVEAALNPKNPQPYSAEYRINLPDGTIRWIEAHGLVLFTGSGDDRHAKDFVGTVADITGRREAAELLRVSEEKYRNLFANITEEVHYWEIVRNESGKILTWRLVDANPPTLKTWGKDIDDIRGKTTDEIFGSGAMEHYLPVVEKIITEGVPFSYEDYFPNLDKYFRFTSVPLGTHFITTGSDITGIRKASEAVRVSEERLRSLYASMTEGVAVHELVRDASGTPVDYRLLEVNPAFSAITGIPEDRSVGALASELYGTGEPPYLDIYARVAETGIAEEFETAFAPMQKSFHISVFSPAKDRFATVFTDITERKRAEEALQVAEEKYRLIVSHAPAMIYEMDFAGTRFISVNDPMCSMLGYTQEELMAMKPADLIDEGSRRLFAERVRSTLAGEAVSAAAEYRGLTRDGREMFVSVKPSIVRKDGKAVSVVVVGYDITERKRAEEALLRAHDELELRVLERTAELKSALEAIGTERHRLYDVLETLPVYVCLLDKDYRMPFANKYFRETFGYSDRLCCHKFLFNLEKPCDNCDSFTVMKTKAPHHWYWTGPNDRNYDIYDFPFYDEQGTLLILEMGIDITEQKKAEDALIKSRDELDVRVQERTADLARKNIELFAANEQLGAMNEELSAAQEELQQNVEEIGRSEQVLRQNEAELKEALEEKEVLLSEIHHRVKNNLAAFISLISLENTYEETPEGRALKKDLQNRARSMALIHETLYRTRKYANVDMGIYLTELVEQIAASYATTKPVSTVVDAEGTTLDIARATPCGLIVSELVTNSFKYAFPEAFDCMAERQESCTIQVSLHKTDGVYLLSVSDNGIGLPAGFNITTTQSLGLKLVNFLAKHQLRAKVGVTVNDGTAFTIRFGEPGK